MNVFLASKVDRYHHPCKSRPLNLFFSLIYPTFFVLLAYLKTVTCYYPGTLNFALNDDCTGHTGRRLQRRP